MARSTAEMVKRRDQSDRKLELAWGEVTQLVAAIRRNRYVRRQALEEAKFVYPAGRAWQKRRLRMRLQYLAKLLTEENELVTDILTFPAPAKAPPVSGWSIDPEDGP